MMPEKLPRSISVGAATIIAALLTGIFTVVAAKQTLRVEATLSEGAKESFSLEAASLKIEELSRDLTLAETEVSALRARLEDQEGSEGVDRLNQRIETLERQLQGKETLIERLKSECEEPIDEGDPDLVREAPGLKVKLLSCRLSGGDELKCDFGATSTDQDKVVYLRRARLVEADSSEVWPTRMQFASSVSEGEHSPGSGRQVYAAMVRGIAFQGSVVFAGVDPSLARQGLPLLELQFDGLDAQFRGVLPK